MYSIDKNEGFPVLRTYPVRVSLHVGTRQKILRPRAAKNIVEHCRHIIQIRHIIIQIRHIIIQIRHIMKTWLQASGWWLSSLF